jgi:hypothetical protein
MSINTPTYQPIHTHSKWMRTHARTHIHTGIDNLLLLRLCLVEVEVGAFPVEAVYARRRPCMYDVCVSKRATASTQHRSGHFHR